MFYLPDTRNLPVNRGTPARRAALGSAPLSTGTCGTGEARAHGSAGLRPARHASAEHDVARARPPKTTTQKWNHPCTLLPRANVYWVITEADRAVGRAKIVPGWLVSAGLCISLGGRVPGRARLLDPAVPTVVGH